MSLIVLCWPMIKIFQAKFSGKGIEAKVGAGVSMIGLVALVTGLASFYHWFIPPPAYLTTLAASLLSGVAAYLAPHTERKPVSQEPEPPAPGS